jgi:hypothetical protein
MDYQALFQLVCSSPLSGGQQQSVGDAPCAAQDVLEALPRAAAQAVAHGDPRRAQPDVPAAHPSRLPAAGPHAAAAQAAPQPASRHARYARVQRPHCGETAQRASAPQPHLPCGYRGEIAIRVKEPVRRRLELMQPIQFCIQDNVSLHRLVNARLVLSVRRLEEAPEISLCLAATSIGAQKQCAVDRCSSHDSALDKEQVTKSEPSLFECSVPISKHPSVTTCT